MENVKHGAASAQMIGRPERRFEEGGIEGDKIRGEDRNVSFVSIVVGACCFYPGF